MVIAIVVAYFTAGAASGLIGGMAGSSSAMAAGTAATAATATTVGTAATAAVWGNMALSAVAASAASNTAISAINNKGNLGVVLKDVTSSDSLKGYAVTGITAGLTAGVYDKWTGTQTGASNTAAASNNTGVLANSGNVALEGAQGLSSWGGVGQFAANQALQNGTSAVLNKALGQDGSLGDALTTTLANTFAAAGFNWVGDISVGRFENGSLTKIGLHAIMGGLAAEAAGSDFKIGALAAGANEALIDTLANQYDNMSQDQRSGLLVMNSQVLGVLVASMAGGDEKDMQIGASVAGNATQYNYLSHRELDDELNQLCSTNLQGCLALHGGFIEQRLSIQERMAELSLDSSIPRQLRADLHAYQLQNMGAVGTLTQAANQLSFENLGLTSDQADLAAKLAATLASGGVLSKGAKATTSFGEAKVVLNSAQAPYKGSTVIGHALSKHTGIKPGIWGKTTGAMSNWNEQGMKHLREITRAPGDFKHVTTDKGLNFIEKRMTDGRGVRLNMDGTFKGFID